MNQPEIARVLLGRDRTTTFRHLGAALGLFVAVFVLYFSMNFFQYYVVPFGPSTVVLVVGVGLISSVINAYWNNGVFVSVALAVTPPVALVTAVEVFELAAPRYPFLKLVGFAAAVGLPVGVCGYLLGVFAAFAKRRAP